MSRTCFTILLRKYERKAIDVGAVGTGLEQRKGLQEEQTIMQKMLVKLFCLLIYLSSKQNPGQFNTSYCLGSSRASQEWKAHLFHFPVSKTAHLPSPPVLLFPSPYVSGRCLQVTTNCLFNDDANLYNLPEKPDCLLMFSVYLAQKNNCILE